MKLCIYCKMQNVSLQSVPAHYHTRVFLSHMQKLILCRKSGQEQTFLPLCQKWDYNHCSQSKDHPRLPQELGARSASFFLETLNATNVLSGGASAGDPRQEDALPSRHSPAPAWGPPAVSLRPRQNRSFRRRSSAAPRGFRASPRTADDRPAPAPAAPSAAQAARPGNTVQAIG